MNTQLMAHTVVNFSTRATQGLYSDPYIVPCGSSYYCKICDAPLTGTNQRQAHIQGKNHLKNKRKQPVNIDDYTAIADLSSTMNISDSPNDLDADIEKALPDVKVFKVDDPIEF